MKLLRTFALGLGVLLAAASSYAQETRVKGNVPFDFIVGNQMLPAGDYSIKSLGSGSAVAIRNEDQGKASLTLTQSCRKASAAKKTVLVFHRVGERYFLSQIWTEGQEAGRQLPQPRAEMELAKNQKVESVVIAASILPR